MASAASPSTANPKMAELCNHTAQASFSHECAEDGCLKCPIPPNIDGDIWSDSGWVFVGFGVGGHLTSFVYSYCSYVRKLEVANKLLTSH
jgi:hypothetical protein